MSEIKITKKNFEEEVINSKLPVLVDFWATWCGPCMMLAPTVQELADQYEGKLKVGKVNVDEEEALAVKFKIMSIPTLLIFKGGEIVEQSIGYRQKEELCAWIDKTI